MHKWDHLITYIQSTTPVLASSFNVHIGVRIFLTNQLWWFHLTLLLATSYNKFLAGIEKDSSL